MMVRRLSHLPGFSCGCISGLRSQLGQGGEHQMYLTRQLKCFFRLLGYRDANKREKDRMQGRDPIPEFNGSKMKTLPSESPEIEEGV